MLPNSHPIKRIGFFIGEGMKKLVYGVGVNDADYVINTTINGAVLTCVFYKAWEGMLRRCYSDKYLKKQPTYAGCSVCDEWLIFSNFKKWMQAQDYIGKHLDKDIIFIGNKIYSPSTCAFIDRATNNFVTDRASLRGEWPIGVSWHKDVKKLYSYCRNQLTGKMEHLGYFNCPNEAHLAWKAKKREISFIIAERQSDARAAEALRSRYL